MKYGWSRKHSQRSNRAVRVPLEKLTLNRRQRQLVGDFLSCSSVSSCCRLFVILARGLLVSPGVRSRSNVLEARRRRRRCDGQLALSGDEGRGGAERCPVKKKMSSFSLQ